MPTYEVEVSYRDKDVLIIDANNEEDAEHIALEDMKNNLSLFGEDLKVEGIIEVVI